MDCKTAQSLVIPYINDQLSDEETEDFLEHIENCKECYEELEIHFTVHYALQKLDEDDKISFNIPKMLKENLRDTKNRIHRRKDFHGVTACVVALAEILLLLTVMTQLEMFPEKSIRETGLYQFFHPGAGEETETSGGNRDLSGRQRQKL
ncbi:MAG: anti-sigma factor family protein [Lachnospiraceae bacterium]